MRRSRGTKLGMLVPPVDCAVAGGYLTPCSWLWLHDATVKLLAKLEILPKAHLRIACSVCTRAILQVL